MNTRAILDQLNTLSPQKAALSCKCCINASCLHNRIRSTVFQVGSASSVSSSESWNTSVVSVASGCGCRLILDLTRRMRLGDLCGDVCKIDLFGSSEATAEMVLEFASRNESARC